MNRLVERADIVDFATYVDTREQTRPAAVAAKDVRRVALHEHLTLLFENRDTLRYQIQEIMRVERTVREADIQNEIDTYNDILGEPGDLGAVLLIHVEDPAGRAVKLSGWLGLQERIYVTLDGGQKVYARFDASQVGTDRISAVQYLQFAVMSRPPVAIGCDFAGLESEVNLTQEQVAALTEDLART